ncbi:hypothetical protein CBR_g12167 [Chara braunii]|uniref:Uncharacterized protein n=1 Tax=Chara braunii TaxID=69332 RepID=A0A388KRA8_CHABU|nr:hypothetical protein CBR_g12167 [Chara braunii]|eukprot:GBG72595.1 hypothetical protein CBR_g12167 [Chara braunii]
MKPAVTRSLEPGLKIVEIGKKKTEDKEEEMKNWVMKTFGSSLRLLTDKLDDVDRKSKLAEEEKEELKRLRAEKELQDLKEGSSSEKRKTPPSTPTKVLISSDEEDDDGVELVRKRRGNLTKKFEEVKAKGKERATGDMTEIKDLLKQLVSSLGQAKVASSTVEPLPIRMRREEQGECSKKTEDKPTEGKEAHDEVLMEDHDELGLTGYMKNRVENYNSMHYTHIMALCKEKNIEYTRKGFGVMELARLGRVHEMSTRDGGEGC